MWAGSINTSVLWALWFDLTVVSFTSMNNKPLDSQTVPVKKPRRAGRAIPLTTPWLLLVLILVLHLVVGMLLSIFSPPYWVWPMAFVGTLIQTCALAGPRALSSFKSLRLFLVRSLTCLGTALSVIALAIAVGFGGSADIDTIQLTRLVISILSTNLGVLLLTALCSVLIAITGDRLLEAMDRTRSSLSIMSFCFLGLFVGGALGLAIASS